MGIQKYLRVFLQSSVTPIPDGVSAFLYHLFFKSKYHFLYRYRTFHKTMHKVLRHKLQYQPISQQWTKITRTRSIIVEGKWRYYNQLGVNNVDCLSSKRIRLKIPLKFDRYVTGVSGQLRELQTNILMQHTKAKSPWFCMRFVQKPLTDVVKYIHDKILWIDITTHLTIKY